MNGTKVDVRENNINLLRLIAASSVIFSHAYDLLGHHDPIMTMTGYSGGWVAVSVFFTLSGYLIYNSIYYGKNPKNYMMARCLRIFPALVVMLILSVFALGLFFSTSSYHEFFTSTETWRYLFGNMILYDPRYTLPGVFENNIVHFAVNGSLWTLRFEFTCYLITLALFLAGVYKQDRNFILFSIAFMAAYIAYNVIGTIKGTMSIVLYDGSTTAKFFRLYFAFFLGMVYARFARLVPLRLVLIPILVGICYLAYGTFFFPIMFMVFLAYITFYFAFFKHPWVSYVRDMPDISYGIYIYAFPIQQALIQFYPKATPLENSLVTLVLTVIPSTISWFLIEKPALDLKRVFSVRREAR